MFAVETAEVLISFFFKKSSMYEGLSLVRPNSVTRAMDSKQVPDRDSLEFG